MNQSILSQDNNSICEVIDCNEIAIQKLQLKAGIYGQIPIYVCKNCIEKFKEVK
jgi:hypothetical protein